MYNLYPAFPPMHKNSFGNYCMHLKKFGLKIRCNGNQY